MLPRSSSPKNHQISTTCVFFHGGIKSPCLSLIFFLGNLGKSWAMPSLKFRILDKPVCLCSKNCWSLQNESSHHFHCVFRLSGFVKGKHAICEWTSALSFNFVRMQDLLSIVWHLFGWLSRDGDMYAALRDCHVSLQLEADYVKAHLRLARCLYELRWTKEALDCLQAFKLCFPDYAMGQACQALDRDIKAAIFSKTENGEFPQAPLPMTGRISSWDCGERKC